MYTHFHRYKYWCRILVSSTDLTATVSSGFSVLNVCIKIILTLLPLSPCTIIAFLLFKSFFMLKLEILLFSFFLSFLSDFVIHIFFLSPLLSVLALLFLFLLLLLLLLILDSYMKCFYCYSFISKWSQNTFDCTSLSFSLYILFMWFIFVYYRHY